MSMNSFTSLSFLISTRMSSFDGDGSSGITDITCGNTVLHYLCSFGRCFYVVCTDCLVAM